MDAQPRHRGWGHDRTGDRRTGAQRARGQLPGPAHAKREEGVRGKKQGAGCVCEAGASCAAVHLDARSGGRNIKDRVHVRVGAR
jgi:hypothetical protein